MTDFYNANAVCGLVEWKFIRDPNESVDVEQVKRIVNTINEFARGDGYGVTRNLFADRRDREKQEDSRKVFRKQAMRAVGRELYGNAFFLWLGWFFLKPLVLRIIEAFIDEMISSGS
jgi:hypothetical protein